MKPTQPGKGQLRDREPECEQHGIIWGPEEDPSSWKGFGKQLRFETVVQGTGCIIKFGLYLQE